MTRTFISPDDSLTPLMRQYQTIKRAYPDALLFFRVGDFYELFFDDAEEASKILHIVLTSRGKSKSGAPIPLCGVPYHAATGYIAKLLKAGKTIALCEQVEDPQQAKGLVRREVVRVYTPGTLFDNELLAPKESNFLVAVAISALETPRATPLFGIAALDLSTGEFVIVEARPHHDLNDCFDELIRLEPKECIYPSDLPQDVRAMLTSLAIPRCVPQEPSRFSMETARCLFREHFSYFPDSHSRDLPTRGIGLQAAGAVLNYLRSTQPALRHHHIQWPRLRSLEEEMYLDSVTIRNLELIKPLNERQEGPTLASTLDDTVTCMGARLLRQWIIRPLVNVTRIRQRLTAVAELVRAIKIREELRHLLQAIYDLERLSTRITLGVASPRDLLALRDSCQSLSTMRRHLADLQASLFQTILQQWDSLDDVMSIIDEAISPDAPFSTREGNIIKDGYHQEIDSLRTIVREGVTWVAELEQRERMRTGIDSLKIKFNQVFGYYIEVTKPNLPKVPPEYKRKQTLVNVERFTMPELSHLEDRMAGADQRLKTLEATVFADVQRLVARSAARIQRMAGHVAVLDVLLSFAECASRNRYVQPEVDEGGIIAVKAGRHPVIEQTTLTSTFIPNDLYLDLDAHRFLLITGPNMAGKSTYLRQAALIVLLAQIGSFVPADEACIGLVDRIFTRVGASDDLSSGRSTFMVEMSETARILHAATSKSLILLDEVGRGTSTFDGLSIAWAVAEYLLDRRHVGARTLFATHYHEMTRLADVHQGIKNYTVLVKEQDDKVLFLRKIVEGKADRSYGIQVAKLAGLPPKVIERAQEILHHLESEDSSSNRSPIDNHPEKDSSAREKLKNPSPHTILEEVKQMDLFSITPLETLNHLADIQRRLTSS
ncbi:MAG: DNA mismatch repair protein MutS [Nitrospirae bacterium]|nr:MAG: DNA mismatch repair protein MutS [Nitrospirota bacterium]